MTEAILFNPPESHGRATLYAVEEARSGDEPVHLVDAAAADNAFAYQLIAENISADFYYAQLSNLDPDEEVDIVLHYIECGWAEGLDPHPDFSTTFYLSRSPDVGDAGVNPYVHYLRWGRKEGRLPHPHAGSATSRYGEDDVTQVVARHLDREYYIAKYPHVSTCHADPVLHYISFGWRVDYDPSPLFSTRFYLDRSPDVKKADVNPFYHYLKWGQFEGRLGHPQNGKIRYKRGQIDPWQSTVGSAFDAVFYVENDPSLAANHVDPLKHFLRHGWLMGRDPSGTFSTHFYLRFHPELIKSNINPLHHFISVGRQRGAIPNPVHPVLSTDNEQTRTALAVRLLDGTFDKHFYRSMYQDMANERVNCVEHYVLHGWREKRDPAAWFSTSFYIERYPEFKNYHVDPLTHYLIWGRGQGFLTHTRARVSKVPSSSEGLSAVSDDMILRATRRQTGSHYAVASGVYDPSRLDIHWLVPDFGVGGGGHMTIFRMVHWLEYFGHRCTIWIMSEAGINTDDTYDRILKHYQFIKAEIRTFSEAFFETRGDAVFATSWDTASCVARATGFKSRFYFVQDYEPLFYGTGARSLLAQATYSLDLACVCASPWLAQIMMSEHGRWARSFWLSHDRSIYSPAVAIRDDNTPLKIAFYGRIGSDRRCVELGLLGLEELARRGYAFDVDIFGTDEIKGELTFAHTNHGIISPHELAELYRACDIGVCFSSTNYSLVPQEMMGCGLPVVELDVESTRAIFPQGVVCRALPDPMKIADVIAQLISDKTERLRLAEAGLSWVMSHSWEASAQSVNGALLERLAETGWTPRLASPAILGRGHVQASIIVPTLNGGPIFKRVLQSLAEQKAPWPFELVVVDSASTDDTVAAAKQFDFAKVFPIARKEFQHGRTRNYGASVARGDYLLFLTQDALPQDEFWLYNFVSTLEQFPEAAGGFGRHVAYPDASPFTKKLIADHFRSFESLPLLVSKHTDIEKWNARDPDFVGKLHFYSDNNSCMRKTAWEKIPYPEVVYGEDQLWAYEIIKAGMGKVYAPNAAVLHSHDYDYAEAMERAEIEGWFFKTYFGYDLGLCQDVGQEIRRRNAETERLGMRLHIPRDAIEKKKRQNTAELLGLQAGRHRAMFETKPLPNRHEPSLFGPLRQNA